jgi:single-strand DNA-binding protein
MANDINTISLTGRLTKDPDYRVGANAPIANFSIAVNYRDKVSYFDCVGFSGLADIINNYLKKGAPVAISGKLQQDRWEDKEGKTRSSVKIIVSELKMLGKKDTAETVKEKFSGTEVIASFDDSEIPF